MGVAFEGALDVLEPAGATAPREDVQTEGPLGSPNSMASTRRAALAGSGLAAIAHAAVRAGGGIAPLLFLAQKCIAAGELLPVMPRWQMQRGTIWLVTPPRAICRRRPWSFAISSSAGSLLGAVQRAVPRSLRRVVLDPLLDQREVRLAHATGVPRVPAVAAWVALRHSA